MSIQYEYHEYCCDGIIIIKLKFKFKLHKIIHILF